MLQSLNCSKFQDIADFSTVLVDCKLKSAKIAPTFVLLFCPSLNNRVLVFPTFHVLF